MKYDRVRNCKWANAAHTILDCEVDFAMHSEEFVPFTAIADGDSGYGNEIFSRALSGEFGPIAEYVPAAEPTSQEFEGAIRAERDQMLRLSDWTQLPDVPAATKTAWVPYRQALRDITSQPGFPGSVKWPVAPS